MKLTDVTLKHLHFAKLLRKICICLITIFG